MTGSRLAMFSALMLASALVAAEQVPVRHAEGVAHGFLALRTLDGSPVADGDLIQTTSGADVTSRLIFRFKDGSLHDETTVFTQRGHFRLVSDHLVQRGPSFPRAMDMTIRSPGSVRVRYSEDGKPKEDAADLALPDDVANGGVILALLKNVDPKAVPGSFSYIAATPKPRLVKLALTVAGNESFRTGTESHTAVHYVLKVELGGLTGVLAGLFGKQPPDSHVWILTGEAPAFVKSEQSLYTGGPVWRIELVSPVWPRQSETAADMSECRNTTPFSAPVPCFRTISARIGSGRGEIGVFGSPPATADVVR
jgi:hypothetical protein